MKLKATSAKAPAAPKFAVGNKIIWKGHPAIVREVRTGLWGNYTIECANGTHVLEFADESFATLKA